MALREVSASRILRAWGPWCCLRSRDFLSLLSPAPRPRMPPPHRPPPRRRLRPPRGTLPSRPATARRRSYSSTFGLGPGRSTLRLRRTTCATRSARRPTEQPSPPPGVRGPAARIQTFAIRSRSPRGVSVSRQGLPRIFAIRSTCPRQCFQSARTPAGCRFSVQRPLKPAVPKHRAASCSRTASQWPHHDCGGRPRDAKRSAEAQRRN